MLSFLVFIESLVIVTSGIFAINWCNKKYYIRCDFVTNINGTHVYVISNVNGWFMRPFNQIVLNSMSRLNDILRGEVVKIYFVIH